MILSSGVSFILIHIWLDRNSTDFPQLKDKRRSWLLIVGGFLSGKRSKLTAINSKDYN